MKLDRFSRLFVVVSGWALLLAAIAHGDEPPRPRIPQAALDALEVRLADLEGRVDVLEGKPAVPKCPCPDGPCICPADACDCPDCPEHSLSSKPSNAVRVLFFTADWCGPCQAAKKRLGSMIEQLEVIDCTDGNPCPEYGNIVYPTCLLIENGEVKTRCVGEWVKPSIVGDWLKSEGVSGRPSPTVKDSRIESTTRTINASDRHSHTCKSCGTTWWHGAEAAGNPRAHNCPRCGRYENVVDDASIQSTRQPVRYSQPAYNFQPRVIFGQSSGYCPSCAR